MADLFPLYVFPEGALASSVITTVLIGVWVTVFFNLRFGWVLSGLVVPGYLTPLILLEPISAAVVLLEAVLTYGLVRAFAVTFAGGIGWTTFFGRDRFFALILASICVRLVMDTVVLPPVGGWLNDHYSLGFDWRRSLESFGLIIIALYANQFWKPGLVAGFLTSAVTIGITLLIVRFGLMELTNFRISDIGYLYELLAASLLASPKAYIILITTAFIASHLNLRAGLDFNGLLIPALIALQWYEPTKILTSVVEAFVILIIASLAMRLPVFANKTIEGGRKLLLFFNISFLWKMLVGYGVLAAGIEFKTADAFGFGYLLSTLIALKLHDKGGEARMITALTVVSAQGALLGTAIGFALSEGARALTPAVAVPERPVAPGLEDDRGDLVAAARPARQGNSGTAGGDAFFIGLRDLVQGLEGTGGRLEGLDDERRALALSGYGVRQTGGGLVEIGKVISPGTGTRIVIDPGATGRLVVSLPRPVGLRGAEGAARALLSLTGARALVIEGAGGDGPRDDTFRTAHVVLGRSVLQVRSAAIGEVEASLEISGRFPAGFDLVALERLSGPVRLVSGPDARDSAERGLATAGFATLTLPQETVYRLTAAVAARDVFVAAPEGGLAGHMRRIVEASADLPVPDALLPEDLLYAEAEILVPLLADLLPMLRRDPGLAEGARNRLLALDAAAGRIGYSLRLVTDPDRDARYLVLASQSVPFGAFAFDAGQGEPVFVHVPTGPRDRRSHAFGTLLFDRLGARALLVAGPAERDGQPAPDLDVTNPDHVPGLYDLVSKLLITSVPDASVSVVLRNVVLRGDDPLPATDLVISEERLEDDPVASMRMEAVMAELERLGLDAKRHDGSSDLAGFEPGVLPQAGYLTARPEAVFLSLWLTPRLRGQFVDQSEDAGEAALFRGIGIAELRQPVGRLAQTCFAPSAPNDPGLDGVLGNLRTYVRTGNPVALQAALAAGEGLAFERLADPELGQAFLVARAGDCVALLVNLNPLADDPMVLPEAGAPGAALLREFTETRRFALFVGGTPG